MHVAQQVSAYLIYSNFHQINGCIHLRTKLVRHIFEGDDAASGDCTLCNKKHPCADEAEAEAVMEERIPIHKIHTIDGIVSPDGQPDGCATCSEKTMNVCGWKVKRWCLLIALFILLAIGCLIPFVIYAVRFGEATSCRLTYTDDATITEAEMQKWMADEKWPLSVPKYDPWRRTCVCKGFEDKDPKSLLPSDEVLVWIAPGDLVSLSDEGKISPRLPTSFLDKYRKRYSQKDHVKVCIRQELVLDLWNIDSDILDERRHCHVSSSADSSNVERFFLGWDGALYCNCDDDVLSKACGAGYLCIGGNCQSQDCGCDGAGGCNEDPACG